MTEMTLAKLKMNGSNNLNGFSWTMARLVTSTSKSCESDEKLLKCRVNK